MSEDKDTKIDEIVQELQSRINRGLYVAGQRLPSERDLTEELDVSRGTIRSALLRLQAENIIDIIPRGGAILRAPSTKITVGPVSPTLPKVIGHDLQAGSFIRSME